MKTIRTTLTFTFDESQVSEDTIKDRLDTLLVEAFDDVADWNARWVANLSDAPFFGAGKKLRREKGGV